MDTTAIGPIIVGDARITVRSPLPRVFEALVKPEDLRVWWAPEAHVEAELGGRYETNPPEGRQEGTIVGLEAPRKLTFTWPIPHEGSMIETTVSYELTPKGAETVVRAIHRAPHLLAHDWNAAWNRALGSLKSFLEAEPGAESEGTGPAEPPASA